MKPLVSVNNILPSSFESISMASDEVNSCSPAIKAVQDSGVAIAQAAEIPHSLRTQVFVAEPIENEADENSPEKTSEDFEIIVIELIAEDFDEKKNNLSSSFLINEAGWAKLKMFLEPNGKR
jgi:hypothetical protein